MLSLVGHVSELHISHRQISLVQSSSMQEVEDADQWQAHLQGAVN